MRHAPDDLPDPPAYDGAWVGAVVPALLEGRQPPWLPDPLVGARQTVLLVVDGLGAAVVDRHAPPTLAAMARHDLDTTVPSTTATALTSITTGRTPAEHGITGYRMRVGGEVLKTLAWRTDRGPDPETIQPHAPFAGGRVPVVTRSEFRGTGFTMAHLRGGPFLGWSTPAVLVEHTVAAVRSGAELVYAYYDGPDKVGHEHGPDSAAFAREIADTDHLVAALRAALPPDCALAVVADHGMLAIPAPDDAAEDAADDTPDDAPADVNAAPADGWHDLRAVRRLVSAFSGEGRFRSLHAGAGASGRLREACEEAYGDRAWVLTREALLAGGWLGTDPSPTVAGRLGDVILLARDRHGFVAPDLPGEGTMRGVHGGVLPEEVRVPLLADRGGR